MFCKICKEEKNKTPISKGDHTRFVDDNNRLWNGKVCPDCYKVYNRERMRKARGKLKKQKDNQISDIQDI